MQIFEHEKFGKVRTIQISVETWFVAKDVAEILGYKDTKKAIAAHCRWGG